LYSVLCLETAMFFFDSQAEQFLILRPVGEWLNAVLCNNEGQNCD